MDASITNVLVGFVGISAVCMVVVQLVKNLVPSKEDSDGNEVGPRRWLAPIIIVLGAVLGGVVGFIRKDYMADDGTMFMAAWVVAGFLIGAATVGLYGGIKEILPGLFNDNGWIGSK